MKTFLKIAGCIILLLFLSLMHFTSVVLATDIADDILSPTQPPSCGDAAPGSTAYLISADVVGPDQVKLTWNPASDPVSSYLVSYGLKSDNYIYGGIPIGGHDATNYTVNKLSPKTTYYFAIIAVNGCMPGNYSNEISAYVPGGSPQPQAGWTFCANEAAQCSFTGTENVRYGANGYYHYKIFTNGTPCTDAVFGDPLYNTVKQCYYQATTVVLTPTPTASPAGILNTISNTKLNVSVAPSLTPAGTGAKQQNLNIADVIFTIICIFLLVCIIVGLIVYLKRKSKDTYIPQAQTTNQPEMPSPQEAKEELIQNIKQNL